MPPPPVPPNPDVERFIQVVRGSRLLTAKALALLHESAPAEARRTVDSFSEHLVKIDRLTNFQVVKLKQGTTQGLVLGHYHILSPLGKGGMGSVFLARDTRKGKNEKALVALKVLPPKKAKEEDRMLARFLREMDMCQRVDHIHLTKTYDAGCINNTYYIAMEYIRGASLKQTVTAHGPLLVSRAARLFAEVADGLQHAHDRGLIHRDLKPSNIMVTPNGHAKILDLGLALAVDEELPADKMIVGGQGYVVGTMDYIAPEQVDDPTAVDGRADLYALGCSIYFTLSGRPPFPGGTSIEKMKRHRTDFADPLSDLNPTLPVDFCRIVDRLMEKKPGRRYPNARAVKDVLAPWIAGDPETPYDVDPDQTEAEAVRELERIATVEKKETFLESIPVAVFGAKARRYGATESAAPVMQTTDPEKAGIQRRKRRFKIVAVLALFFQLALCGGVIGGVVWLVQKKRAVNTEQTDPEQEPADIPPLLPFGPRE